MVMRWKEWSLNVPLDAQHKTNYNQQVRAKILPLLSGVHEQSSSLYYQEFMM